MVSKGPYQTEKSPGTGNKIKEDGFITNVANRTDEAMIQDGYRIIASGATATPTAGKVFVAIRFPAGGSITTLTDASLLEGDITTITYVEGDIHYGRAESYAADAITIAVEGV